MPPASTSPDAGADRLHASRVRRSRPRPGAVAAADLNYDFRTDLVIAGPAALLLRQDGRAASPTSPAAAEAAAAVAARAGGRRLGRRRRHRRRSRSRAWRRATARRSVLRNNGDGTFAPQRSVRGRLPARAASPGPTSTARACPDAALLDDAGTVHVLLNQRGGGFRERVAAARPPDRPWRIAAAELNGDAISRPARAVARRRGHAALAAARPDRRAGMPRRSRASIRLPDLAARGRAAARRRSRQQRRRPTHRRRRRRHARRARRSRRAFTPRRALRFSSTCSGRRRSRRRRPPRRDRRCANGSRRSRHVNGRQKRITGRRCGRARRRSPATSGSTRSASAARWSCGPGCTCRSRLITSPVVHFGLGEAPRAEVVAHRLAERRAPVGVRHAGRTTSIKATQRLKGSCPWLFAWNGREMAFVTDLIWRSPLGLRINAQAHGRRADDRGLGARSAATSWRPRDGAYDLRITAELWETHFFDLVSLMVVDHPAGTEVFVDERFAVPPPALAVVATGPVQPCAAVRDDQGHDVSRAASRARRSGYLDFAGRGAYQGITRRPLRRARAARVRAATRSAVARSRRAGCIRPTARSTSRSGRARSRAARACRSQVADAARPFPHRARRPRLPVRQGQDGADRSHRRLPGARTAARCASRTNLEIFWDRLGWAVGRPDVRVAAAAARARARPISRYRGYSVTEQRRRARPSGRGTCSRAPPPRWRDLEGYYTRFGDVRRAAARRWTIAT